jgi:predicted dehydrogenase
MDSGSRPMRIGVLGAARIVKNALIDPARLVDGVEVEAIAARDHERARRYAARHGIRFAHPSYQELLADPVLDAVYIPLPAALHARWAVAAIEAGKHVLCEKPFTSNTAAAEEVAEAAAGSDCVVMEAYHSHHHPLQARLRLRRARADRHRPRHVLRADPTRPRHPLESRARRRWPARRRLLPGTAAA